MIQKVTADTKKIALSSIRMVYKTEGFISLTRKIIAIDAFISRLAESIFREDITLSSNCFTAQTEDGLYTLFFRQNSGDKRLGDEDIVFYKFLCANTAEGGIDRRLSEYMSSRDKITFVLKETADALTGEDLTRLYLVSGSDGIVNFPYLNETQRKIVETEDANMLVQGIAGSGKTNVCVEKIVYCACRNYRGAVLYTTFSRGL